jgi:hypothetical protein
MVGIHALHPLWAHGQLYTAITRVTSALGLSFLCDPALKYNRNGDEMPTVRNIVHSRVSGRTAVQTPAAATALSGDPNPSRPVPTIDEADSYGQPEFQFYDPAQGGGGQHSVSNHAAPPHDSTVIPLAQSIVEYYNDASSEFFIDGDDEEGLFEDALDTAATPPAPSRTEFISPKTSWVPILTHCSFYQHASAPINYSSTLCLARRQDGLNLPTACPCPRKTRIFCLLTVTQQPRLS